MRRNAQVREYAVHFGFRIEVAAAVVPDGSFQCFQHHEVVYVSEVCSDKDESRIVDPVVYGVAVTIEGDDPSRRRQA